MLLNLLYFAKKNCSVNIKSLKSKDLGREYWICWNEIHFFVQNKPNTQWKISKSVQYLSVGVAWRCSVKKVYWKISQNLQENTCTRGFFSINQNTALWVLLVQKLYQTYQENLLKAFPTKGLGPTHFSLFFPNTDK